LHICPRPKRSKDRNAAKPGLGPVPVGWIEFSTEFDAGETNEELQNLHFIASIAIISAQYGHFFLSLLTGGGSVGEASGGKNDVGPAVANAASTTRDLTLHFGQPTSFPAYFADSCKGICLL
jgi:hypothetical protein